MDCYHLIRLGLLIGFSSSAAHSASVVRIGSLASAKQYPRSEVTSFLINTVAECREGLSQPIRAPAALRKKEIGDAGCPLKIKFLVRSIGLGRAGRSGLVII